MDIIVGETYINDQFRTEIVILKFLGGGKYWVRGAMGDFKIREQLLRSSYRLKEKGNGTDQGAKA